MIAMALGPLRLLRPARLELLLVIPTATPEIVLGASLLSLFLIYGLSLGFTTLLIAHVMFCISFVVIVVRSRLIGFDRSLEEAAEDLGADPFRPSGKITLPLIWPGIVGGALLAFALSIDDFIVSDFNKGTTEGPSPSTSSGRTSARHPGAGQHPRDDAVRDHVLAMIFFVLWQQRRAEPTGVRAS